MNWDTIPNLIHEASFCVVKVGVWCILNTGEDYEHMFKAE
jgi:hypothetical protein